jgi:hypothetical protein
MDDTNFERVPMISPETMEALRQLAVPIMRLVAFDGDMNREVRIDSLGVRVFSPDAGSPFTGAEEAQIFQERAIRA